MSSSTDGTRPPERLAYWYFRLNGFLTTENFVVHPDQGANQRTDADVLAVRFAHREENQLQPMRDHPAVATCATYANVVIAEVKTSECALNGPWTDPGAENMPRLLKAIGCVPESHIKQAGMQLYESGSWANDMTTVRLFALGNARSTELPLPVEQQITWDAMIDFIIQRCTDYRRQKSAVGQWAEDGRRLMDLAQGRDPVARIRAEFGLPDVKRLAQ